MAPGVTVASGKIHRRATFLLTLAGAAIAYQATADATAVAAVAGGGLLGLWCHPDRDQEAHQDRLAWWLYARWHKHRSRASHRPVVGTALRLLYWWAVLQLGMIATLSLLAGSLTVLWLVPPSWSWPLIGLAAAMLAVVDADHWILDGCP